MGRDALTWEKEQFTGDWLCSNGARITNWHDERDNFYTVTKGTLEKDFRLSLEEAVKFAEGLT